MPQGDHINSKDCFKGLDRKSRANMVLKVYQQANRPLMDREVMNRLAFQDINCVQPRITELIGEGKIRESGKMKSPTGKTVRVCEPVKTLFDLHEEAL